MSVCCGSICYGGEFEFKTALVSALSGIVPIVREGVYTGEDAEKYITFVTSSRGTYYSNDAPTLITVRLTLTLWARHGCTVKDEREEICKALVKLGGTYPNVISSVSDGWGQYVYESEFLGRVTEV